MPGAPTDIPADVSALRDLPGLPGLPGLGTNPADLSDEERAEFGAKLQQMPTPPDLQKIIEESKGHLYARLGSAFDEAMTPMLLFCKGLLLYNTALQERMKADSGAPAGEPQPKPTKPNRAERRKQAKQARAKAASSNKNSKVARSSRSKPK